MGSRRENYQSSGTQDIFLERMSPLLKEKYKEVKRKIDLHEGIISGHFRSTGKMNILKFPNRKS